MWQALDHITASKIAIATTTHMNQHLALTGSLDKGIKGK